MSDKADAKAPAAAKAEDKGHGKEAAAGGGKAGLLGKTPIVLGAVMLIEAVVLIGGFKFIGGGSPKTAAAVELATEADSKGAEAKDGGEGKSGEGKEGEGKPHAHLDPKAAVELALVDFRAPNKQSGRTFLYDVSIFVTTRSAVQDKVKDLISGRDALIKDRVRTIIAQMDPDKLGGGSEPGLETLRRQVKYQLDQIIGDGLIDEVLVPRCIAFRTDY